MFYEPRFKEMPIVKQGKRNNKKKKLLNKNSRFIEQTEELHSEDPLANIA